MNRTAHPSSVSWRFALSGDPGLSHFQEKHCGVVIIGSYCISYITQNNEASLQTTGLACVTLIPCCLLPQRQICFCSPSGHHRHCGTPPLLLWGLEVMMSACNVNVSTRLSGKSLDWSSPVRKLRFFRWGATVSENSTEATRKSDRPAVGHHKPLVSRKTVTGWASGNRALQFPPLCSEFLTSNGFPLKKLILKSWLDSGWLMGFHLPKGGIQNLSIIFFTSWRLQTGNRQASHPCQPS